MQFINCSGVKSEISFHNGFPSRLAYKSQRALTIAPKAKCIAPFSGPIQRS
jgi:hypothetical protein